MRLLIGSVVLAILALCVFGMVRQGATAERVAPRAIPATTVPEAEVDAFLAPLRPAIEKTRRPVFWVSLDAMPSDDVRVSKVGGRPYWNASRPYPQDARGRPMILLAQIDFAEIPAADDGYPDRGLLQFFIADDHFYGANLDGGTGEGPLMLQRNFRVVHWPDANAEPVQVPDARPQYAPHDPARPRRMRFSAGEDAMSMDDHRFAGLLGGDAYAVIEAHATARKLDASALYDAIYDRHGGGGHKVGGYPAFTQEDPRVGDELELLFQLDSDSELMWGDAGVGGFFIAPQDLARGDFSRVMYSWDCH